MNSNLERVKEVMNEVYGKYEGPDWIPRAYSDNKSRYLWTDAFGVCNYITLYNETRDSNYLKAAECLIKNVHDVLGKERNGNKRLGNATDQEPTKCGLRIGKVNEEWQYDGDGQYFHYLTKWMFALSRMSMVTNEEKYLSWAIQMAEGIHPRFVYNRESTISRPRMIWKMCIDLSRPAVQSEGNLDPYDGLVTYKLLREASSNKSVLQNEISDMERMVENKYRSYSSSDPLDLGEALWLSHWFPDDSWAKRVSKVSLESIEELYQDGYFHEPLRRRLAFREFGTTLGVQCNQIARDKWSKRVEIIHDQWKDKIYSRDKDITPVMYCTSLLPGVHCRDYKLQQ